MKEELSKELKKRGTAEIINGEVYQATQAIDENKTEASFLMFGERVTKGIIPIDEACAKCDHPHFDTVEACQERQDRDARARGFSEVICPKQFR